MNSKEGSTATVGVFGIGLEAYWYQFDGLKERLEGYRRHVEEQLGRWAQVVSPGLVDTTPKAYAAGERFAEEGVDVISATPQRTPRARRSCRLSRERTSPWSCSTSNPSPPWTTK